MTYFINGKREPAKKLLPLLAEYDGREIDEEEARQRINDPNKAVIILLDFRYCDSAIFAYSQEEFDKTINRKTPKRFLLLNREKIERDCGYHD